MTFWGYLEYAKYLLSRWLIHTMGGRLCERIIPFSYTNSFLDKAREDSLRFNPILCFITCLIILEWDFFGIDPLFHLYLIFSRYTWIIIRKIDEKDSVSYYQRFILKLAARLRRCAGWVGGVTWPHGYGTHST